MAMPGSFMTLSSTMSGGTVMPVTSPGCEGKKKGNDEQRFHEDTFKQVVLDGLLEDRGMVSSRNILRRRRQK